MYVQHEGDQSRIHLCRIKRSQDQPEHNIRKIMVDVAVVDDDDDDDDNNNNTALSLRWT